MQRALASMLVLAALLAGCVSQGEPLQRGSDAAGREATPPGAAPAWADAQHAQVRPGTPIHTEKRDCPSNFLFQRADTGSVFLGSTANCFRDMPVGTVVSVGGGENVGFLVYSSFQTMADEKESDPNALNYNDFAVVYLDQSVRPRESPALVGMMGPTGHADPSNLGPGSALKEFVPDGTLPDWRDAIVASQAADWALLTYSPLPATPGHMGGAVVDGDGRAVGVVVNLGVAPNPGAVGVARLDKLVAYASEKAHLQMELVTT